MSKKIVVLPKSVTPGRIVKNLELPLAANLDAEDIKALDAVAPGGKQQRFIMPPWPVDLRFGSTWTKKTVVPDLNLTSAFNLPAKPS